MYSFFLNPGILAHIFGVLTFHWRPSTRTVNRAKINSITGRTTNLTNLSMLFFFFYLGGGWGFRSQHAVWATAWESASVNTPGPHVLLGPSSRHICTQSLSFEPTDPTWEEKRLRVESGRWRFLLIHLARSASLRITACYAPERLGTCSCKGWGGHTLCLHALRKKKRKSFT